MVHFVILNVEADIKVLVLCVGNIVQIISEMMEHFVLNQNHMVEEEVMHFGIKKNVKENINKDVKNMVYYIIQNVEVDIMLQVVVYVHQIV